MVRFRRVAGEQAGPEALGILVPPGRRTVVILRPRSLDVDLLALRPGAEPAGRNPFWEVGVEQGEATAEKLTRALEQGDGISAEATQHGTNFLVCVEVGYLPLIACRRQPGQPYRTLTLPDRPEADAVARQLLAVLKPAADSVRELYVNLHGFAR